MHIKSGSQLTKQDFGLQVVTGAKSEAASLLAAKKVGCPSQHFTHSMSQCDAKLNVASLCSLPRSYSSARTQSVSR